MKTKHVYLVPFLILFLCFGLVAGEQEETREEEIETRRGIPVGISGRSYGERAMSNLVEHILGTDEKANPERLEEYLERLENRMITEGNFIPYEVQAQLDDEEEKITLDGHAGHPYLLDIPGIVLGKMGFEVDNNMQLLPDKESLGDKLFAVQKTSEAYVRKNPDNSSEVVTQGLYGHHYFLLKKNGDFYYVHADEGYLGYIHKDNLSELDESSFTEYLNSPKVFLLDEILIGERKFSAGSLMRHVDSENNMLKVKMVDENEIVIPEEVALPPLDGREQTLQDMLDFARTYKGTSYDWGGKSCDGLDCSGFTQMVFRSIGVQLPRDSYMQFNVGQLVATPWYQEALEPGDTMFFVSPNTGRIVHVAISTGNLRYIHAEEPVVTINSLDPEDDDYVDRRKESFFYGKRPYVR